MKNPAKQPKRFIKKAQKNLSFEEETIELLNEEDVDREIAEETSDYNFFKMKDRQAQLQTIEMIVRNSGLVLNDYES